MCERGGGRDRKRRKEDKRGRGRKKARKTNA